MRRENPLYMDVSSVNLDQVSMDIDNILSDIKSNYMDNNININIPDNNVNPVELENACKIFGCGADK
jgi:hypothetical protein